MTNKQLAFGLRGILHGLKRAREDSGLFLDTETGLTEKEIKTALDPFEQIIEQLQLEIEGLKESEDNESE